MGFWAVIPLANAARVGLGLGLPAAWMQSAQLSSGSSARATDGLWDGGRLSSAPQFDAAPKQPMTGVAPLRSAAADVRVGRLSATERWSSQEPSQKVDIRKVFGALPVLGPWLAIQPMMGLVVGRETRDTGYRVHEPNAYIPGMAPLDERWKLPQTEILPVDESHGVSLLGGSGERIELPVLPGKATADRGQMDVPLMSQSDEEASSSGRLRPLKIQYEDGAKYGFPMGYTKAHVEGGDWVVFGIEQTQEGNNRLVIPRVYRHGLPPGSMAEFVKLAIEKKYREVPLLHEIVLTDISDYRTLNDVSKGTPIENTRLGRFVERWASVSGYQVKNLSLVAYQEPQLRVSLVKTEAKQNNQFFYRVDPDAK